MDAEVPFAVVHDNVDEPPELMEEGCAESVHVGAGFGDTVTVF